MAGGRRHKLNEDVRKTLVQAVLNGLTKEEAALCAGVTVQTLLNWERRAEKDQQGEFFELFEALKKAQAQLRADCLATIHRARRGGEIVEESREVLRNGTVVEKITTRRKQQPQWQAAAWILERECPERWARRTLGEIELLDKRKRQIRTNEEGVPWYMEEVSDMDPEDVKAIEKVLSQSVKTSH